MVRASMMSVCRGGSAAAAAVAEKEAKVAVEQTITAAQTAVDATIAAPLNPNAASFVTPKPGGRRTKKGGKKKMRKTRRPTRVFKY